MLPNAHVLYGILLALTSWFLFPGVTWFEALLILFSSIFIDVDHYIWYVIVKKDWNLKRAYYYLRDEVKGSQKLMIFHTIEFLIVIGLLSFIWFGFYYIFIGVLYHFALDMMSMIKLKRLKDREYSLIHWLKIKKKTI